MFTLKNPPLSLHIYISRVGRHTHAEGGWGGRGECKGQASAGAVSKDRVPGPALQARVLGCCVPTQAATGNEILHSWEARGSGVQEVSWGAGTPSWSLHFPWSRQEREEGFLVRKTEGPGLGCRHPPTPRLPGTWAVSLGHMRAPPEEPGRTWGVSWALGGDTWPSEHLRGKALGQVCPGLSASGAGTR